MGGLGVMNVFIMILWSFVIRATPFRKIFAGLLCSMTVFVGLYLVTNIHLDMRENNITLIGGRSYIEGVK